MHHIFMSSSEKVLRIIRSLFLSVYSKIVEKIDEDHDGFVTVDEMKRWIKHAQKRWIYDDVDRQWHAHDLNSDAYVSWEEYKNATYGYILGVFIDESYFNHTAHRSDLVFQSDLLD